jgi:hypothetical protein
MTDQTTYDRAIELLTELLDSGKLGEAYIIDNCKFSRFEWANGTIGWEYKIADGDEAEWEATDSKDVAELLMDAEKRSEATGTALWRKVQ